MGFGVYLDLNATLNLHYCRGPAHAFGLSLRDEPPRIGGTRISCLWLRV